MVRTTATASSSLYQGLTLLSYDRPAYEIAARVLWDLLATESATVEPAGPECAYAVLTGELDTVARRTQVLLAGIASRIGATVRAGIAWSKFAARVAAESSGDGSARIPAGTEAEVLARLPICLIAGIPPKAIVAFAKMGVPSSEIWQRCCRTDYQKPCGWVSPACASSPMASTLTPSGRACRQVGRKPRSASTRDSLIWPRWSESSARLPRKSPGLSWIFGSSARDHRRDRP